MSTALPNELVGFDGKKLITATAIGPSAAASIANASGTTITLSLQPGNFKINNIQGVQQIIGLPIGITLGGFSVSGTNVNVVVFNATSGAITVNANSVTAVLQAIGW